MKLDESNIFWKAISEKKKGNISSAKKILESIINETYDNIYSPLALMELFEIGRQNENHKLEEDVKINLQNLSKNGNNSLQPYAFKLLAREESLSKNFDTYITINKELLEKFPKSDHEITALFNLVNYYFYKENDIEKAKFFFQKMENSYPKNNLTRFAAINLNENIADEQYFDNNNEAGKSNAFLSEAFPNPFNPSTKIYYNLTNDEHITLIVYDILGKEVKRLADGVQSQGMHTVYFDASTLPSGIYIYQLTGSGFVFSKKMQLIK